MDFIAHNLAPIMFAGLIVFMLVGSRSPPAACCSA
jgi:hypothetical protein